jgi:hypothetical protein
MLVYDGFANFSSVWLTNTKSESIKLVVGYYSNAEAVSINVDEDHQNPAGLPAVASRIGLACNNFRFLR